MYNQEYYLANREKLLAQNKAYREANRDAVAERQRQYRERVRDRRNAQKRSHYRANHERIRAIQKVAHRKYKYGLEHELYESMLQQQGGRCAICRRTYERSLCVDHCHKTGEVRGLLCNSCNIRLGLIENTDFSPFLAYLGRRGK